MVLGMTTTASTTTTQEETLGPTQTGGTETVTIIANGATATLDMNAGRMHKQTTVQSEDVTLSVSNAASGKRAGAQFTQNGTGGWVINIPGSWKKIGSFTFTIDADKTNWVSVWQTGAVFFYTGGVEA